MTVTATAKRRRRQAVRKGGAKRSKKMLKPHLLQQRLKAAAFVR